MQFPKVLVKRVGSRLLFIGGSRVALFTSSRWYFRLEQINRIRLLSNSFALNTELDSFLPETTEVLLITHKARAAKPLPIEKPSSLPEKDRRSQTPPRTANVGRFVHVEKIPVVCLAGVSNIDPRRNPLNACIKVLINDAPFAFVQL